MIIKKKFILFCRVDKSTGHFIKKIILFWRVDWSLYKKNFILIWQSTGHFIRKFLFYFDESTSRLVIFVVLYQFNYIFICFCREFLFLFNHVIFLIKKIYFQCIYSFEVACVKIYQKIHFFILNLLCQIKKPRTLFA